MPDFTQSKVYKLSSPNSDKVYIGSTTQEIEERKSCHLRAYKLWKEGKHHYVTAFILFELGPDVVSAELLEEVQCQTREELLARERYYIENNNSINKIIPGRSQKEYKKANQEYIKEKALEYYNQNRDSIIEKAKDYRVQNRSIIRQKSNVKKICSSCQGRYTIANKSAHERSKKHFLANFLPSATKMELLLEQWDETSDSSDYESDSDNETTDNDSDSDSEETVYMFSEYENDD
jgi:hypothetical protein